MQPYYTNDDVHLYCGDARDLLPQMPIPDATIVDPPYNQTSLKWDRWVEGWPALVPGRSLWCFGTLRMFMDRAPEFVRGEWKLSQDVVWEKQNGTNPFKDRFRRVHEQVAHFYRGDWSEIYKQPIYTNDATKRAVRRKKRPPHWGVIDESAYTSHDGGPRLQRSVIHEHNCHGYAIHETEKPLALLLTLIEYATPPNGLILDSFAGSGSTGEAAMLLGRRAILIEGREELCEKVAQRLDRALPVEQQEMA